MSSSFAQLMALSASQTQQSQSEVQNALAERQRKQEQQRRQQEERERKEREQEAKIRMRKLQDAQREEERLKRLEDERAAKERERERREEEQRNHLLGTKKAREYPSSSSGSGSAPRVRAGDDSSRHRRNPGSDDDSPLSGAAVLTREEKRARKEQAAYKRAFPSAKRPAGGSPMKAGRRLPGGAIDMTAEAAAGGSGSQAKSAKERILAAPNTLTKLNTVKRDTRTIDEIMADRAKAKEVKVLDGDEAREFSDWFGVTKKKEAPTKRLGVSPLPSGASSPAPSSKPGASSLTAKKVGFTKTTAVAAKAASSSSLKPSLPPPKSAVPPKPKSASGPKSMALLAKSAPTRGSSSGSAPSGSVRKRHRSTSLSDEDLDDSYDSDSPPPSKRRGLPGDGEPSAADLSAEIWKLFGKDKRHYVERDVLSDDEDMEVDAAALEREEKRSHRLARKEDAEAEEEERRREEEKRRKRREKDARERKGGY